MRIKKLELIGFKSFKDRTVIQFDAGITGVVGPNGCGKSNIVDALVWVMGEMSAKHLRGSSMEDVIFAGAEGYAPMGMAEVSLTLENDGGPFPVQYLKHSEIMVTRRLHRSGESEYLVNKEPARLKDIQEIFMDTGAGSKGFSIIEQGAIGRIITAKPEDRRTLIEEAAGITKFKVRKRESQRKLISTEQNLVRLHDIVGELKRQIDSLQRQAQRAERYRNLKREIEDLDLWISSRQWFELKDKTTAYQTQFETAQAAEIESSTSSTSSETELETLRTEMASRETNLSDLQNMNFNLKSDVQRHEAEIQELRFEIEQARRNKEMTGSLLMENETRKTILETDLAKIMASLEGIRSEADSLTTEFQLNKDMYETSSARIDEIDAELSDARREFLTVSQGESTVNARLASTQEALIQIRERSDEAQMILTDLREKSSEFEAHRKKTFNSLEKERQTQFDLARDVETIEANKAQLTAQITERREEVEQFKDALNETTSRLYGLENLHSNFEGFQEGVKSVMFWQRQRLEALPEEMRETATEFRPVAEVVEVPGEYELAMEAALGPRLQMLLAEDSDKAASAVDYLKAQKSGRSSFYAGGGLQTVETTEPNFTSAGGGVSAVRAILKDVVRTPERFKGTVDRLLSNIAIVDSLPHAFELRDRNPDWTFVTMEGDLISSDGVITGGTAESADSGVLKRSREIKELSGRKEEWKGKLALAQTALRKMEAELQALATELEGAVKRNIEREIMVTELKKDLERAENEYNNAQTAIARQERETLTITQQLETRENDLNELTAKAEELRTKREGLESRIADLDQELLVSKSGIDDLQSKVTELQVKSATRTQEAEGLQRQADMLSRSLEDVQMQLTRMGEESSRSTETMTTSQVTLEEKKVALEAMINQSEEISEQLSRARDEFEQFATRARELEKIVSAAMSTRNQLQASMNEARLHLEQARMRELYLQDQIRERYIVELSEIAERYRDREGDVSEAEVQVKDLRDKLGRIGDVNLSAIEEYDEVAKRYEFLSKQQEELVEAKEQLKKVIDRINRICSRRFRETFDLVNERFTKVYPVLFGGGEANLILVEDVEKGEMGIDILAKPPGKKMQSVSLLSGGEKALTAVALIFSIFLVKPSPYCLLDEVDAPLDDANVFRFNDLVREMAKRSQIIVVTHNKYTMEVASKLYGVTMQEKGVSKMVSVNLGDAQHALS